MAEVKDSPYTSLAVIPARGGSKTILRKNLVELGGKSLLAWTLEAALSAKYLDWVVVSTDDPEIKEVAEGFGVDVVDRPIDLAGDDVLAARVVRHFVQYLEQTEVLPKIVSMLFPTSPFRTAEHIDNSILLVKQGSAESVIGIGESSPLISLRTLDNMVLKPLDISESGSTAFIHLQHKDVEPLWLVNGAIFTALVEQFLWHSTFHMPGAIGLPMDRISSIEIDSSEDLELARSVARGRY